MKKLFVLTALFVALAAGMVYASGGSAALELAGLADLVAQHLPEKQTEGSAAAPRETAETDDSSAAPDETRAVWVATAYAIDYPSAPATGAGALRSRCRAILDEAAANGCNTVYFQVRPAADALYPSDLFPWSRYLTGTCGAAPEDGFDPLAYWTEQAHARGMRLEAWVNPYRICAGQNAAADFAALPASHPARQHPDWVVSCDGGYYFDPGRAEVRQLICDGVEEIVSGYDVDGVQFDDYFYPSTAYADDETYAASGSSLSRDDWRRDNVNRLIQAVGEVVRTRAGRACVFGVSPSGIWRNRSVNAPGGSETNGYEHYTSAYADSLTWIENGWIDYICPQIYWEIGDENADFDTLARWWARQTDGTDVALILGLAAYKIGSSDYTECWRTDGCAELARQIALAREIEGVDGCALFSFRCLEQTDGLSDTLRQLWS